MGNSWGMEYPIVWLNGSQMPLSRTPKCCTNQSMVQFRSIMSMFRINCSRFKVCQSNEHFTAFNHCSTRLVTKDHSILEEIISTKQLAKAVGQLAWSFPGSGVRPSCHDSFVQILVIFGPFLKISTFFSDQIKKGKIFSTYLSWHIWRSFWQLSGGAHAIVLSQTVSSMSSSVSLSRILVNLMDRSLAWGWLLFPQLSLTANRNSRDGLVFILMLTKVTMLKWN